MRCRRAAASALSLSPTAPFLPTAEEMGERTPAETAFLHFLSALYRLSMQSCVPTQSAFSYPLSFRRLCQHSFPLPLSVATVNSFVLSCYGTTNISHPVPAGHTYPLRCFAPQWARFDNRQKRPAHQPLPSLLSAAAAQAVQAIPRTDNVPRRTNSASTHRQIYTCPPRAKGSLDRRSKRLSFPHFFLRRKKCGRRRPSPRQGETDSPPQRRNPPRAKGSLNRRFEWFSLVTFF